MAAKKSTVISKGRSPAFQYYPDKYDTHTRHLSDYSYRVYHRIINWMWLHSPDYCSCPADDAAIAVFLAEPVCKISDALKEIQNEHMPLLKCVRGKYVSAGLKKEAAKQKVNSDRARAKANARWDQQRDATASKGDATAMPQQCNGTDSASFGQCIPTPSPIPTPATPKSKSIYPSDFEEFWQAYPKKKAKGAALKAWKAQSGARCDVAEIVASINSIKTSKDWTKDSGQWIPYPATWINAHGWADELALGGCSAKGENFNSDGSSKAVY